jgi:hypothetical protein
MEDWHSKICLGPHPVHFHCQQGMTQCFNEKASRGKVIKEDFGQRLNGQRGEKRGSREASECFSEELKNPNPVSGADPSTPRGLFHPNASTVTNLHCTRVSAILKLS